MEINTLQNSYNTTTKGFAIDANSQKNNILNTIQEKNEVSIEISYDAQKLLAKESMTNTTKNNALAQTFIEYIQNDSLDEVNEKLKNFNLDSLGLENKNLLRLTQEEALALTDKKGFLSQESTTQRVIDHALDLAQNNIEFLHEIREGLIEGFEKAEEYLGIELSKLAYETQYQSLETLNQTIIEQEQ